MNRRSFLAGLAAGIGAIGRAPRLRGQRPPQATVRDSSDRLYDPSVVQSRSIATAADTDPLVKGLEHRLKCTCGCNLDIYTCRTTDFTCSYSPALHREVLGLLQERKSPDEVVAAFVGKYGEQILMAPRPEGFNLAGYLLPGALLAGVGGLLTAVLLRRARRVAAAPAGALAPPATDPAAAERLRRALGEVQD